MDNPKNCIGNPSMLIFPPPSILIKVQMNCLYPHTSWMFLEECD